jgi:anti-sigma B factor antagonist
MKILESTCNGSPVLRVQAPRIDAASAPEFRRLLAELGHRGLASFVLDLTEVGFVDSTGLGALVSAFKLAGRPGGVVISGANASVRTLLKITRMDRVFRLFETETEAAAALVALSS